MTAHVGANLAREIGAHILALADHDGLTVADIAKRAGMPRTQLQRQIDGEDAMNTDHMMRIAAALKAPVTDLLASVHPWIAPELGPDPDVDFEEVVYEAHREGWAMTRA